MNKAWIYLIAYYVVYKSRVNVPEVYASFLFYSYLKHLKSTLSGKKKKRKNHENVTSGYAV